ncbi:MAG: hypothetical protein IID41_07255 [Planctomycetes bacterium]|nr:hypothetical protein [Planctomycetota bacterium]
MSKATVSKGFGRNFVLFLVLFAVGVAVFVLIPVFGWLAGPLICLASPFVGGSSKVWRCKQCRVTLPRG